MGDLVERVKSRSPFVGREVELIELETALRDPGLVSLLGPGGVGKTRLCGQLAARLNQEQRVVFVWLDELTNGDDVAGHIAQALGLTPLGTSDVSRIVELLASESRLLVLDNAEHVLQAVRKIVEQLPLSTSRVVVTSRVALDLPGERQIRVNPLPLDDARELLALSARRLGIELAADDHAVLLEALDCLPLAIELAAARTAILSPREILDRLSSSNHVIGSRAQTRHGTLDRTVAWSWDLLDDAERSVAATVAWFDQPIAPELATEMWPEHDVLSIAQELEAKSWLRVADTRYGSRWTALWAMRRFVDGLVDEEMRSERGRRLREWAVSHLTEPASWWAGHVPAGVEAARAFEANAEHSEAARLLSRLFFGAFGGPNFVATVEIAVAVLQAWDEAASPSVWARLAANAAKAAFNLGGRHNAVEWAERAVRVAPSGDPAWLVAGAQLVLCLTDAGEYDAAQARLDTLVAGRESLPQDMSIAASLVDLITAAHELGRFDVMRDTCHLLEAVAIAGGNVDARARAWFHLAQASYDVGEFQRAAEEIRTLTVLEGRSPTEVLSLGGAVAPRIDLQMGRDALAYEALEARARHGRDTNFFGLEFNANLGLAEWAARNEPDQVGGYLERAAAVARLSGSVKLSAHVELLTALDHVGRGEFEDAMAVVANLRKTKCPVRPSAWKSTLDAVEWFCVARSSADVPAAPASDFGRLFGAVDASLRVGNDEPVRAILDQLPAATWNIAGLQYMRLDDVALRWFERLARASARPRLVIEPSGHRFRIDDQPLCDISRRAAMRRILLHLATHQADAPGNTVDVDTVIEVGWPGEMIQFDAARTRVYTTMNRLRALGLENWLMTLADGYALDPQVEVVWVDDLR